MMRTSLTYLLVLMLLCFSAKAQENDLNLTTQVDSLFNQYFGNETPGAAVAISVNGELVVSNHYGLANLEHNIPITDSTKFHLTSGSKQFTAYAILKLEQQNLLSLEDEIHQYLPKLQDFGYPITIKHLLTHTSGIRQETQLENIAGYWKGQVMTQSRALELIYAQTDLNFEPGTQFIYSNSGYTLLSEIIKNVTQETFESWMLKNVFEPLAMNNTIISEDYSQVITNRAESYNQNKDGYYRDSGGLWHFYGGTGVYSCTSDILRWLAYLDNPSKEDQGIISRMEQETILANGDKIVWGLGLVINKDIYGQNRIWHSGDSPGYHTWIGRYPDKELGIVILTNLDSFDPGFMAEDIARVFLLDQEQISTDKAAEIATVLVQSPNEITGWYNTEPIPHFYNTELWRILDTNGALYFNPGTGTNIRIRNTNDGKFELDNMPLELMFKKDSITNAITLILRGPDGDQLASKISNNAFELTKAMAEELVGKYYSPELKIEYEVFMHENKLRVRHLSPYVNRRWYDFDLEPLKADTYLSDRSFFTFVTFKRDPTGNIIGFRMTTKSQRVQNLWFGKK